MAKFKEKLAESSSYNLLGVYLSFILGILTTFLIARLLYPEEWAIIILVISLIYICVFICNLFPPNAHDSIKYYIPHLISNGLDEINERRKFIFHVYKIRLFSSILVYISFLAFLYLANFSIVIFQIIIIMSPIILFDILKNLNTSVLLAFQKFKRVFTINFTYPLIVSIGFLSIYFLFLENPITLIAFIYLISSFFSCIISIFLVFSVIPSKKRNLKISISSKEKFLKLHKKYGLYLTIADIFTQLTNISIYLLFVNFDLIIFITWLTICEISVASALQFSSSNPNAYISIFSEINYQRNPETFLTNFYQLNKFVILLVCIIVAIMIFFIEIYITIIYSQIYLSLIIFLQIYLITTFFRIIIRNLLILTQSTNNTKVNAEIAFLQMIFFISAAVFALLFFSFFALILLFLLDSFILTLFSIYLVKKALKLKLKALLFFKPLIIFIICYICVLPLNIFINFKFIDIYLLNVFINSFIKFMIFILMFYILIYFTKVLTKEEFNQLISIIPVLHSKNNLIKKLVNTFLKCLPSNKK